MSGMASLLNVGKYILQIAGILMIIGGVFLLSFSMVGLAGNMALGGGSAWRFDYSIDNVRLSGTTIQGTPFDETFTDFPDPYGWDTDLDGAVQPGGAGGLSGIAVSMSLQDRWVIEPITKQFVEAPTWNYVDPNAWSYNMSDRMFFAYYYSYELGVKTVAKSVNNGLGSISETGYFDVDVRVKMHMSLNDPDFTTEIEGHWGDVHFLEVTHQPVLMKDLEFASLPLVDVKQDIGDGIGFQEATDAGDYKTAILEFRCGLQAGQVKAGFPLGIQQYPYDMWVYKRVMVCLLLSQPFEVGGGSDPDPYEPHIGVDWTMLAMGAALIVSGLFVLWVSMKAGGGGGGGLNNIFNMLPNALGGGGTRRGDRTTNWYMLQGSKPKRKGGSGNKNK